MTGKSTGIERDPVIIDPVCEASVAIILLFEVVVADPVGGVQGVHTKPIIIGHRLSQETI